MSGKIPKSASKDAASSPGSEQESTGTGSPDLLASGSGDSATDTEEQTVPLQASTRDLRNKRQLSTHSLSPSITIKKARVDLQQSSVSVSAFFPGFTRQANEPPVSADPRSDKVGASSNCTFSEKEAVLHRPQHFSDGLHFPNRIVALQKLGFSGVERPFEIIALLRERGITGERLSECTRDNAFDLGTVNVQALAAEHRETTTSAQVVARQRTQPSPMTITGALKDSSPVLNNKPIDLSKEEDPFPITESDDQVLVSCPDSPLDAEKFSLFNPSTDSAKFKSAIEAASRKVVANPCSPLKNVLSFSDKKKAPSRRVSSVKSSLS
jgi:hypothetical protein